MGSSSELSAQLACEMKTQLSFQVIRSDVLAHSHGSFHLIFPSTQLCGKPIEWPSSVGTAKTRPSNRKSKQENRFACQLNLFPQWIPLTRLAITRWQREKLNYTLYVRLDNLTHFMQLEMRRPGFSALRKVIRLARPQFESQKLCGYFSSEQLIRRGNFSSN